MCVYLCLYSWFHGQSKDLKPFHAQQWSTELPWQIHQMNFTRCEQRCVEQMLLIDSLFSELPRDSTKMLCFAKHVPLDIWSVLLLYKEKLLTKTRSKDSSQCRKHVLLSFYLTLNLFLQPDSLFAALKIPVSRLMRRWCSLVYYKWRSLDLEKDN